MHLSFASRYIEGHPAAQEFLPLDFRKTTDRMKALAQASRHSGLPHLASILRRQNQPWGISPTLESHLQALAQPGTTVVVTGQQVGLFLGPLYTLYKAATAILWAQALSQESKQPVVPVFWLQTEDHDFEEIRSCWIPRTGEPPLCLNMPNHSDTTGTRQSISERTLGPDILNVVDTLASVLGDLPHAQAWMDCVRWAYQPENTWHDAFARLLSWCFREEGLVLLNPRDPELAALGIDVHRKAMEQHETMEHLLVDRANALERAGFQIQVPVGKNRTLSFFHPEGAAGDRYRCIPTAEGFELAGCDGFLSWPQLSASMQHHPMQWSTSALLRPIWQDHLLPTVGYVGGPGEISYLAQMAPLYEWFERPMPLVIPRGRFVLVDSKSREALSQWKLSVQELSQPEDLLLSQILASDLDKIPIETLRQSLIQAFSQALSPWQNTMIHLEDGLRKVIEKTVGSVEQAVDKLVQKVERVQLHRDQALVQKLRTVRIKLFPNDQPQERVLSLPYFAALYGITAIKEAIKQQNPVYHAGIGELLL